MPITKLKEFLDSRDVKYLTILHSPAYTAQEIAQRAHVPGQEMAKTVIVKIDDRLAMAVLGASAHVDLAKLRAATAAPELRLATEQEFKDQFPDCEVGAMPPFGNLYGMQTFIEETLSRAREIVFNAGSHTQVIRLACEDYMRLVNPTVLTFASAKARASADLEERLW
jgi:Ala-tRNA(Pro) deacylase